MRTHTHTHAQVQAHFNAHAKRETERESECVGGDTESCVQVFVNIAVESLFGAKFFLIQNQPLILH